MVQGTRRTIYKENKRIELVNARQFKRQMEQFNRQFERQMEQFDYQLD